MINTPDELAHHFRAMNKFDKLLDIDFKMLGAGDVDYTLTIQEKHLSSIDTCHGGVLSGYMDAILGLSTLSYAVTVGSLCSTVEFKINFISPAKLGETLKGKASIDHKGKTLVITSGDIREEKSGRLVAKAQGTFNLYPIEKKFSKENP